MQTQIRLLLEEQRSSLIWVYTVCNSLCIVWMYYSKEKSSCSTFRVISANFRVSEILGFLRYTTIRPVARQGSSPETGFSFLKHFRILYPFIPNTIQINQRLCNNRHCKDLTQKNSKSVTLILRSCTRTGMVLHKSILLMTAYSGMDTSLGASNCHPCNAYIVRLGIFSQNLGARSKI